MLNAYRNLDPEQFVDFVSQRARLPVVSRVGVVEDNRPVFVLSRDRSTRIPDPMDQTG
jgi:hypothetical protein